MKGIFGYDLEIKLDLFHTVQRISSQIPKHHPYRKHSVASLRLMFRQPNDLEKDRKRETPCSTELMKNIENFKKQWENVVHDGVKVLNKKAHDEIEKLKKHFSKRCLSSIPAGRGTHRNENLHKNLKKNLSKSRVGVQTATALLGTFFYVWNERILQRNTECTAIRPISAYESEFIKNKIELTKEIFGTGVSLEEVATTFGADCNYNEQCQKNNTPSSQNTFEGFAQDAIADDSDYEEASEEEEKTVSALFSSMQCQSAITKAIALKTVYEKLNSQCKARNVVNPRRLHLLSKGLLSFAPRKPDETTQIRDSETKMKGLLEAFGMSKVIMPGDVDCFFSSVSFQLAQIVASGKNPDFAKRLGTLGITASSSQREIIRILRRLVVEEWLQGSEEMSTNLLLLFPASLTSYKLKNF